MRVRRSAPPQTEAGLSEAAQSVLATFLSEERFAQHLRTAERAGVTEFAHQLSSLKLSWPRRRAGQLGTLLGG